MTKINFEKIFSNFSLLATILVGVVGNVLNFVVLSKPKFKKMSTYRFFFWLSIIDLFVLVFGAMDAYFIFIYNFELKLISNIICKIHMFITYYLIHMSSMVLMLVSCERFFVISGRNLMTKRFPLCAKWLKYLKKIKKHLKLTKVSMILIITSIIIGLINSHYLVFLNLQTTTLGRTEINLLIKKTHKRDFFRD